MRLAALDEKTVRITMQDGDVFEGECSWFSSDYAESEWGRKEDGLQIDNWLFFRSDIGSVREIARSEHSLWMNRTVHRMRLDAVPFARMEAGRKTIELRLYDEKRRQIRAGDVIRFESRADETDVLYMLVTDLLVFDSFADLYRSLPLTACGYTEAELPFASPEDMNRYYSLEDQQKYGVVGIRVAEL